MQSHAQAQATRAAQVTHAQSLSVVKNLMRASVSEICWLRNLFDDDCFEEKVYAGLRIKTLDAASYDEAGALHVHNEEAYLITQWLEKGVFVALQERYLRSLVFAVHELGSPEEPEGRLVESYTYDVEYPSGDADDQAGLDVRMGGERLRGGPGHSVEAVRQQAVQMVRNLVSLMNTITALPQERCVTMKLFYWSSRTPRDWQPEFFVDASAEPNTAFESKPLRFTVGKLGTPFHNLGLAVSTLEEDEGPAAAAQPMDGVEPTDPIVEAEAEPEPEPDYKPRDEPDYKPEPGDEPETCVVEETQVEDSYDAAEHLSGMQLQRTSAEDLRAFVLSERECKIKQLRNRFHLQHREVVAALMPLVADGVLVENARRGGSRFAFAPGQPQPQAQPQAQPEPQPEPRPDDDDDGDRALHRVVLSIFDGELEFVKVDAMQARLPGLPREAVAVALLRLQKLGLVHAANTPFRGRRVVVAPAAADLYRAAFRAIHMRDPARLPARLGVGALPLTSVASAAPAAPPPEKVSRVKRPLRQSGRVGKKQRRMA